MVIDDQLSSRRHLAKALTDSGFAVVGEGTDGRNARPGVVVAAEVVNLGRELL